jgi:acetoin utilization deacetylase AcuC-like enzyme
VRAFFCDTYEVPLPAGHRFPMAKYRLLRERLLSEGVLHASELEQSDLVDRASLLLAHTPEYVDAVFSGGLSAAEQRALGFTWSEALLARSRASVFGTVAAARAALRDGIAGNLAGGTHHAHADRGSGFCVFNDLAVAARALQREGEIGRAVVVDLDVHQGDGTAAIFAGDESVFTFSMHGAKNFPFRKQRSSLDVELPDGCDDAGYLAALERHLPDALDRARADLAFFQAGVDPLRHDALGRLGL